MFLLSKFVHELGFKVIYSGEEQTKFYLDMIYSLKIELEILEKKTETQNKTITLEKII